MFNHPQELSWEREPSLYLTGCRVRKGEIRHTSRRGPVMLCKLLGVDTGSFKSNETLIQSCLG